LILFLLIKFLLLKLRLPRAAQTGNRARRTAYGTANRSVSDKRQEVFDSAPKRAGFCIGIWH